MDDIHTKHDHPPEENPAVSYERSDLDIFAVTKFGIGLAIGTVASVFLMWGLFQWFTSHTNEAIEQLPPSVIQARQGLTPPEPRLQSMGNQAGDAIALRSPSVELRQLRQEEAMQLDTFAWVDPNKGIVRIPVEVAKDLVLKKGLPSNVSPEGRVAPGFGNHRDGVGSPSADQPQWSDQTGAAAVGSAQVTKLPEEEKTETGGKK